MDSKVHYVWQSVVLDALTAPPELLPLKINTAQRAIAARLNGVWLDNYEGIALKDALNVLHILIAESRARTNLQRWTPATAPTQRLRYGWQEAVFDAFVELSSERLPEKVHAAKRGIYQRLSDSSQTDVDERIALREALLSLRELSPKDALPEPESENKERSA
jgi:hypothetical protein